MPGLFGGGACWGCSLIGLEPPPSGSCASRSGCCPAPSPGLSLTDAPPPTCPPGTLHYPCPRQHSQSRLEWLSLRSPCVPAREFLSCRGCYGAGQGKGSYWGAGGVMGGQDLIVSRVCVSVRYYYLLNFYHESRHLVRSHFHITLSSSSYNSLQGV